MTNAIDLEYLKDLKPDLKKIIVLLIIISPIIFSLLNLLPLPAQFDLLNTYFTYLYKYILMIPLILLIVLLSFLNSVLVSACSLGGFGCGKVWLPSPITSILVISFVFLIWYVISCGIVSLWNDIFISHFGEKKRQYERIITVSLTVIFIFIAIILPAWGTHFIFLEKNTFKSVALDKSVKLQELRIQNNFILPVTYKLPDVTACLYDSKDNLKYGYAVAYRTEDGKYVNDMDPLNRNVIVARPNTETKIYLQEWCGIECTGIPLYEKSYLFNWDEISGNDSRVLINFLEKNYNIDWVKTAKIEKIYYDNGIAIRVFTDKNELLLFLNNKKTEGYLEIPGVRTDKFKAKMENGKLNIYSVFNPNEIKFDEIILLTNGGMDNYDYCYSAKDEDILVAEKIKISEIKSI